MLSVKTWVQGNSITTAMALLDEMERLLVKLLMFSVCGTARDGAETKVL